MKVIAIATLYGEDRKPVEPGAAVDLPAEEAKSLVARGLAVFPAAKKTAAEEPPPAE